MKCDKCFFCCHIGSGIYADYPVKYCKYKKKYLTPFVPKQDGTLRQLDFREKSDLKIWHNAGCNIHPSKVAKAKRDFIKGLEGLEPSEKEESE